MTQDDEEMLKVILMVMDRGCINRYPFAFLATLQAALLALFD
jgi:hypothetical protein